MITTTGPALGLIELESLARGVVVADALVKRADVHIALAEAVTPGKFVLLFTGSVAEVDESFQAGLSAGGALVLDRLFLPHIAEPVLKALEGKLASASSTDAVGLVETRTVASALRAADAALKCTAVVLTHLALARGIGGKGWFTLAGVQHDVEAALEAASSSVGAAMLVGTEIVPRPHEALRALGLT